MFDSGILAEFRSLSLDASKERCAIVGRVTAEGPGGEHLPTDDLRASDVPCRVTPLSVGERNVADALREDADAAITLPAGQAVAATDRIDVTGARADGSWAQSYEVTGIDAPKSFEVQRRVRVKTLRSGVVP